MPRTGRPQTVERVALPCAACGATLYRRASDIARLKSGRAFCNNECLKRVGAKPRRGSTNQCAECSESFYALPGAVGMFCSRDCHNKHQKRSRVELECVVCNASFTLGKATAAERGPSPTCSRKCDTLRRTTNGIGRMHNGRPVILWSTGYLFVYEPDHPASYRNGWLAEHRYVVEQHLGRRLTPKEHVHHLNGVKTDNRIENLVVLGHSEHSSITGKERQEQFLAMQAELAEYRRRYGPLPKE